MLKRFMAFALMTGAAATPIASADYSAYVDIVVTQLDGIEARIKPVLAESDRQMIRFDRIISATDNDRNGVYYLTDLEPNTEYLIVGVCDGDCSDIDLQIEDDDGDTVGADVEDDDSPVLEFRTSAKSDHYKLTLDMVTCSAEVCFYGIDVFDTDE
ncbi:unnamed protein product [Ectocarpus sp. 12 AP-2014]